MELVQYQSLGKALINFFNNHKIVLVPHCAFKANMYCDIVIKCEA